MAAESWAISERGEEFSGEFASRDEALEQGRKEYEGRPFHISKARRPMASEFVRDTGYFVEELAAMIEEGVDDDTGEEIDLDPSDAAIKELTTLLKAWADKTFGQLDVFIMEGEPEKIAE